ncbi:MAG: 3'-5' exonuclease [Treponema sp.]|nr:3'-5' exonuclease [Treponema sp.]
MTVAFVDTETTGLDPRDSGPFEIAFLVYSDGALAEERVFALNPLGGEVLYHESAALVHGVSEATIRSYPAAAEAVPEIAGFLRKHCPPEKIAFAGYNAAFDYAQVSSLLFRHGASMDDFFSGKLICALELAKRAAAKGLLPKTRDFKLGTMTKALGIPQEKAHSALDDARAARLLYEAIFRAERKKKAPRD